MSAATNWPTAIQYVGVSFAVAPSLAFAFWAFCKYFLVHVTIGDPE